MLTAFLLVAGFAALIALAVAGLLALYGWLATDDRFFVKVFGG